MTKYIIAVTMTYYGYDLADALCTLNANYSKNRMRTIAYVYNKNDINDMIQALQNSLLRDFKNQCVGKIGGFRAHIWKI